MEIGLNCNRVHNNITRQLDLVRESLLLRFRHSLTGFRSKDDKLRVLNYPFKEVVEYLSQIEHLQEQIEMVVEDIDKASYTISRQVELAKIISHRREVNI